VVNRYSPQLGGPRMKYWQKATLTAAGPIGATAFVYWLTRRSSDLSGKRFEPYSAKARELFRVAALSAGLPPEWADDPGLHYILNSESGGYVGIPNYKFNLLFGSKFNTAARAAEWPKAWEIIRLDESASQGRKRHPGFNSRASGLGQLQPAAVKSHYPDKLKGVGDPVNEAVGMLRYIASRYGSPAVARSVYGRGGKGDEAAHYTHAITGAKRRKTFREGY